MEWFPWDDLRKILRGCQRMAKVPNAVEILQKILTIWVGCTSVTDDRLTDRRATAYSEYECEFMFVKNGSPDSMTPLSCLSVCPVCLPVTLVYYGQMVGRIRMPLGSEVGLGPGHIVFDGDPASPWKGAQQLPTCGLWKQASLRRYKPQPMSVVAKWLDRSGCQWVWR